MHLYLYSFDKQNPMAADAKLERQLTQGDFEVLGHRGRGRGCGDGVFLGEQGRSAAEAHFFGAAGWVGIASSLPLTRDSTLRISATTGSTIRTCFRPAELAEHVALRRGWGVQSGVAAHETRSRNTGCGRRSIWSSRRTMGRFCTGGCCCLRMAPASGKIPLIVNIYGGPAAQMVRKGLPDRVRRNSGAERICHFCSGQSRHAGTRSEVPDGDPA